MSRKLLVYGANGFVGEHVARTAAASGVPTIVAGRDAAKLDRIAAALGVESRAFGLSNARAIDGALKGVAVVLNCAGPFKYTAEPLARACLRAGAHYLDITGEIPVYEALQAKDAEAKAQGVMLMPGVGFDVVPTDCLALHLKQRLPSATRLRLAFRTVGPAGLPPGTQRTAIELLDEGVRVRRNGKLVPAKAGEKTIRVDFGDGAAEAMLVPWADVFTAWHSTGIPNIESYFAAPPEMRRMLAVGPEAGVVWTTATALGAARKALGGVAPAGYQTPASAFGADFVLETEGVTREDVD